VALGRGYLTGGRAVFPPLGGSCHFGGGHRSVPCIRSNFRANIQMISAAAYATTLMTDLFTQAAGFQKGMNIQRLVLDRKSWAFCKLLTAGAMAGIPNQDLRKRGVFDRVTGDCDDALHDIDTTELSSLHTL
jgi:hypothetical protein